MSDGPQSVTGTGERMASLSPEQADRVFRALASAQRREILRFIARATGCGASVADSACRTTGPVPDVCACRIVEHLGLAASTISHHMALLRDAGLVTARKDGTWVHYALRREVVSAAAGEVAGLSAADEDSQGEEIRR